ncbi:MAG: 1-acyl-sn-glycerol-3-phosphate acyltransferase [Bacteroidales bacterium]|nr:1-acyl-sn-glycerol-3-phosphate acyltransferase [Bacteroidales bacterium]
MSPEADKEQIQKVDLRGVFYSKNPGLAKLIPGFIYRYLRKVIHENDINEFLDKHGNKFNMDFINAAITDFKVSIETQGEEYLKMDGRFIFASNHPLGGFDGLVLMQIVNRYFNKYKFLVNDILMNLKNIQELFIPINKHGKQATDAVREIDEAFRDGTQILTFPAGLVSRKIRGQIIDLPWQKQFIMKAKQFKREIIPVHFSGNNTNFFYNLANIRKFIGIKSNIEMLYLVDETYKHKNKHLVVKFGEPIPWQTFDSSKKPLDWARWVKEKAYALDGVYDIPF